MSGPSRDSKVSRVRKRNQPKPNASTLARPGEVADIETHRTLRRDFGLTGADIADFDIDLAIEAGLLSRPARPQR